MFPMDEKRRLLREGLPCTRPQTLTKPIYDRVQGLDDVTKMQYLDINVWLVGDILLKADRMSMANSLELRVPFLDKEVFAVASRIPRRLRVNRENTKVAMRKAETLALGMSGLISGIARVFAPLVSFLTVSTNGVLRLIGINPDAPEDEVSEEEILMMVDAGSEKGTIDHEERDFIQNVFDFDNLSIESIVTHRTDVKLLDIEDSSEIWDNTIRENPYTYFPVCDGSPDKIIGVLNSKLYFRLAEKSRGTVMEQAVKPAYFVPESLKADALFRNMKKERSPFAVVLDEYGGMSGIITIKDLIEELVGDLEDDVVPEQDSDPVKQLADGSWLVDGSIDLEELSSVVGVALSSEDYDTLNGLIFHKVGRLPEAGMELTVESLRIRVEELREYQIKLASIKRITD